MLQGGEETILQIQQDNSCLFGHRDYPFKYKIKIEINLKKMHTQKSRELANKTVILLLASKHRNL